MQETVKKFTVWGRGKKRGQAARPVLFCWVSLACHAIGSGGWAGGRLNEALEEAQRALVSGDGQFFGMALHGQHKAMIRELDALDQLIGRGRRNNRIAAQRF